MSVAKTKLNPALSRGFIMDSTTTTPPINPMRNSKAPIHYNVNKVEYRKGHERSGARMYRYFPMESLCFLVCLTMSLLILPLILPPLPPPPASLLLLPICIMVLLMFLAFMPSNARDVTTTYTYA